MYIDKDSVIRTQVSGASAPPIMVVVVVCLKILVIMGNGSVIDYGRRLVVRAHPPPICRSRCSSVFT
jgi:hypothetical protein